jgi:rhamnosyltransferase subunit B
VRIVFTTWGSLGDLHPYMALALEMKRRGHQPTVATLGAWREAVEGAGIRFHPIRPDVPADPERARQMVLDILDARNGPKYLFEDVMGPVIRDTDEDTLAAVKADGGADALVTHQIPVTGPIVAQVTRIPWVSCVLLPMAFMSTYDPPTPPQAAWVRSIAALHPAIARGLLALARGTTANWIAPITRLRAELGLPPDANPVFEGQHSPARVLGLFSPVFAAKQPDHPPQLALTGFPFYDAADSKPPDPELLRFLDAGSPPIVFTLGSSAVWIAGDFYRSAIAAARSLGQRALLLAGEQAVPLGAAGLPAGIAAFDYAPHSAVMPRAAATVHQGGVGTTAQALRAGRPQLVVPFGQDQPDNARRVVALGAGRTISRSAVSPQRFAKELRELLENADYARRAESVGTAIRNERGVVTACDEIERVMAPVN